jgi:hypothetical protein
MAQELAVSRNNHGWFKNGSRTMMAQEPGWFENNHGSSTMMAQEPYTLAQNNDGSMFSKLQAISKHSASKVKQTAN